MTDATVEGTGLLSILSQGAALIYDGNPVLATGRGALGCGSAGSAGGITTEWRGTFNDAAVWPVVVSSGTTVNELATQADPVNGYLISGSGNGHAAGTSVGPTDGSDWVRNSIAFVPSRRARFLVPGANMTVGASQSVWLDDWQLSVTDSLINWEAPKRLKPTVVATRVNYSFCNGFEHDGTLTLSDKIQASSNVSVEYDTAHSSGGRSAKISITPGNVWTRESQMFEVTPGDYLSLSFSYANPNVPMHGTYRPAIEFFTERNLYVSTVYGDTLEASQGDYRFSRSGMSAEVPEDAYFARTYWITGTSVSSDEFLIDDVLVEEASVPGEYFDGSFGPDYLWMQGVATGDGWSFYYEDRIVRNGILRVVLENNIPLGVTLDEVQYGTTDSHIIIGPGNDPGTSGPTSPRDDDPTSPIIYTGGYGSGEYGAGPYGG